jgi:hypothetical protein
MKKTLTSMTLRGLLATALLVLPPALFVRQNDSIIARYPARVTATQIERPRPVTSLNAVSPRLEQELRTGFVHQ